MASIIFHAMASQRTSRSTGNPTNNFPKMFPGVEHSCDGRSWESQLSACKNHAFLRRQLIIKGITIGIEGFDIGRIGNTMANQE